MASRIADLDPPERLRRAQQSYVAALRTLGDAFRELEEARTAERKWRKKMAKETASHEQS